MLVRVWGVECQRRGIGAGSTVIDFGAEGDFRRLEGIIRCEGDVQKKDSSRVAVRRQIIQARSHSNTHTQHPTPAIHTIRYTQWSSAGLCLMVGVVKAAGSLSSSFHLPSLGVSCCCDFLLGLRGARGTRRAPHSGAFASTQNLCDRGDACTLDVEVEYSRGGVFKFYNQKNCHAFLARFPVSLRL